jgi:hypothetical protein
MQVAWGRSEASPVPFGTRWRPPGKRGPSLMVRRPSTACHLFYRTRPVAACQCRRIMRWLMVRRSGRDHWAPALPGTPEQPERQAQVADLCQPVRYARPSWHVFGRSSGIPGQYHSRNRRRASAGQLPRPLHAERLRRRQQTRGTELEATERAALTLRSVPSGHN